MARGGAYADAPPPPPSADGSFKAMTRHSRPENDRSLFVAAMTVAAATPAEGAASSAAEEFLDLHEFGAVPAPAPAPPAAAPRSPEPARHLTNVRMSRRRQPAADGQLARGVSAADAAAARLPDPMRFIQPTPAPPPPPGGERHVARRPAREAHLARGVDAADAAAARQEDPMRFVHADILLPVEPDSLPPPMPELHLARGLELGQTTAPRADPLRYVDADALPPVPADSLPPPMPELHLARGLELGQSTTPRADPLRFVRPRPVVRV